jgi:hypothetical protein
MTTAVSSAPPRAASGTESVAAPPKTMTVTAASDAPLVIPMMSGETSALRARS